MKTLRIVIITLQLIAIFGLTSVPSSKAHEISIMTEVYLDIASQNHKKTNRMARLQKEVFKELGLEKQYPMYFADTAMISTVMGLNLNVLGICFPTSKAIVINTRPFYGKRHSDASLKLTIAHEILHCYAGKSHDDTMISMKHLIEDGDIYNYKGAFGYLDSIMDDLLENDKCPASIMYPSGIYAAVCEPYMYEIYMNEARQALRK